MITKYVKIFYLSLIFFFLKGGIEKKKKPFAKDIFNYGGEKRGIILG